MVSEQCDRGMATGSGACRLDDLEPNMRSMKENMQMTMKQIERLIKITEKKRGGAESSRSMAFESHKPEISTFNGSNPDLWILQAEKYFSLKCLNNEEQLEVSARSFEGVALRWFRWENQRRPFSRWEDLKSMVLRQFCSVSGCLSGERFPTLKQGVTMERDNIEKSLQEKGVNTERGKEVENAKERDRDRGRVGLVDDHLETLPTPSPPSPLSLLSFSPSPTPLLSSILPPSRRMNTPEKGSVARIRSHNEKEKVSSEPIWPKPNQCISIWPNKIPNAISLTANGGHQLGDDLQKLPPRSTPPSVSPPLPPSLPPHPKLSRSIHVCIPTVGEPPPPQKPSIHSKSQINCTLSHGLEFVLGANKDKLLIAPFGHDYSKWDPFWDNFVMNSELESFQKDLKDRNVRLLDEYDESLSHLVFVGSGIVLGSFNNPMIQVSLKEKYDEAMSSLVQMEKRVVMAESMLESTLQHNSDQVKARTLGQSCSKSPKDNNKNICSGNDSKRVGMFWLGHGWRARLEFEHSTIIKDSQNETIESARTEWFLGTSASDAISRRDTQTDINPRLILVRSIRVLTSKGIIIPIDIEKSLVFLEEATEKGILVAYDYELMLVGIKDTSLLGFKLNRKDLQSCEA